MVALYVLLYARQSGRIYATEATTREYDNQHHWETLREGLGHQSQTEGCPIFEEKYPIFVL
jgi:hypothetical protein